MPADSFESRTDSLNVPWDDTVRFVRQLSHDLRNDLNAIELQSTYISELTQDQEQQSEVKRLREIVAGMNAILQQLSRTVGEVTPNMIHYRAAEFLEDMRTKTDRDFPKECDQITWDVQVDGMLNVDPQLFQEVFTELFANAFRHGRGEGPLLVSARIENDRLLFSLHEPKAGFDSATQNWGREPLRNISQRHYGLGLNRVRLIIEAHGGELQVQHDAKASALVSTISLPVSTGRSERV
ncbi:MAG TPA: HAMP domain-containing sensor histidine kinase [Candidatus Udaeobacter sp.]|jgi:K+-sensing histidine kinase KdpD